MKTFFYPLLPLLLVGAELAGPAAAQPDAVIDPIEAGSRVRVASLSGPAAQMRLPASPCFLASSSGVVLVLPERHRQPDDEDLQEQRERLRKLHCGLAREKPFGRKGSDLRGAIEQQELAPKH